MDILNKKGFVKIGVGAGFIIAIAVLIFFSSSLLTQTAAPTDLSGNIVDDITDELIVQNTNKPVLIDFTRLGGDGEGDDETGESGDESDDENDESIIITGSGFFGGGGGGIACCPPPTHKECDYGQLACVVVQGAGTDECQTFEDCPQHKICDDEQCVIVEGEGEDECETDSDCEDECIPPYLATDKTAEPSEVLCEEVEITLTVSGEGEICDGYFPVDVVLVFDNSGSMDDDGYDDNISDWQPIGDAKIAAKAFVDLLGSNDKVGLVSFNTVANLEHGLSFDKNSVKTSISGMSAGGWTNMSQGIDYANQELINNGRTDKPWVEVLLSDGNNNCGSSSPPADCHQRVFDSAQEAVDNGIVIYTIALGNNSNQSMMQDIADITGGGFYYAPTSEDLEDIYEEIAEEVTDLAATDVVVIDYLPIYAELNQSTLPPGCEYNDTEGKITCEIGDMDINETVEFSFNIYLYQTGYVLTNLYPDSGVEYTNYNQTTVFEEFPETHVTVLAYDCDHTECNYVDMTCDLVLEPGVDECETFDDCPHYTVCDYVEQVCVIEEGVGINQCETYDDCFHAECSDGYCIDVQGVGSDLCQTDSECRHLECNYVDLICEEIFAIGISECQTFQDCPQHTECDYQLDQCVTVEGTGTNECSTYSDCIHTECCGMSCITVQSTGTNECSTDVDCTDYICNYDTFTCDAVAGSGYVECQTFQDCPQHTVCDYVEKACVTVEGSGENQCLNWGDCIHTECNYVDFTCDTIESQGIDECFTFDDCPQHKICDFVDELCIIVEGAGVDECGVWEDCYYCGDGILDPGEECETTGNYAGWGPWGHEYTCKEDNTYYHCVNCQYEHVNECEYYCSGDIGCDGIPPMTYLDTCTAYGYGYLQDYCNEVCELEDNNCEDDYYGCTSDPQCDELVPNTGDCNYMCQYKPSHTECNYQTLTCDLVASPGENDCVTFEDCPQHRECDFVNELCIIVEGVSTDECWVWEDCEYCGNERIDPGEDCEPPFDGNNPYCDQSTTDCSGHKLGTRDPFGYCDGSCGCVDDPFNYSCVEEECGAECDEDTDCPCPQDGCVGPDWYDYPAHGVCTEDCICDVDETPCEGPCKPNITRDDTRCTRYVCDYQDKVCVLVDGDGPDECFDYSDCIHAECNYQAYTCDTINAPGINECVTFDDCDQHTVCDYVEKSCVIVEGTGTNECSTYPDCVHTECCGMTCITVNSAGTNECSTDADCIDRVCNYDTYTCDAVAGTGYVECSTFDDCPHYTVCDYVEQACVIEEGVGINQCETYDDCFHAECSDGYCIDVQGVGSDLCQTDSECRHTECNYQSYTCDEIFALGTSECSTFQDCPQHTVCNYQQQACVTVEGTGINQCSTYSDCIHTECNYNTLSCDTINAPGMSECQTFQDCPQHKICDYQLEQCRVVEGTGTNECSVWGDCLYCGDGTVTSPEECEFPGTNNNPYCSQATQTCSGKKLGVRDAFGYCDDVCGCIDDPFSYSCVEGQCGAECDSDDDCDCPGDRCMLSQPHWQDYPDYSNCFGENCTCAECEPTLSICDPRCMEDCEVEVKTGHDMNPDWGYPYTATDDIWIMATDVSNGACDGWTIRIRYWWCSCPNNDPKQSAIEYDQSPKYDRLCSANAAGEDNPTHSLECAPCEWRDYWAEFPQDSGKKFWTGVGSSTGTFQIDIRDYHDCYTRKYAVALACAAKSEDEPVHLECKNKACQAVAGVGADQCNKDSDCYFYKCVDQACVKRAGTQADQCATDADCVIQTHTECNSMTCVDVSGSGTDECSKDCDCYHLECSNQQCVQVTGDGQDLCSVNSDCVIEYHNECIGFKCQSVPGLGFDECFDNFECEEPMI